MKRKSASQHILQVELHRHLDVSIRLRTLLELAQERGLEGQSTSLARFRSKIVLKRPLKDLKSVLARFTLCQKVLDRPAVLERVAFETIEDCHAEGTDAVELRFSPSFISEFNQLSWKEILDSFELGIKRGLRAFPKMKVGLICIASRDYGIDSVEETVDFFLKSKNRFIGFDLAGNEVGFPCRDFTAPLQRARRQGAKITIHAGEASGPENIWEAIELLGAHRIGHGIAAIKDSKLVRYLSRHRICLEMCPTSNWLTQAVPNLGKHPLKQALTAGIPVSISTDDPTIFGMGLDQEIQTCRRKLKLSQQDLEKCLVYAQQSSFLDLPKNHLATRVGARL